MAKRRLDYEEESNSGSESSTTDSVTQTITQAIDDNIIEPILTLTHTDLYAEYSLILELSEEFGYTDGIIEKTQEFGFEEMRNIINGKKENILYDAENNPDNVLAIESSLETLENSGVDFTNPLHFILVLEQEDIEDEDRESFASFLSEIPNESIPQALALAALFGCNNIFRELVNAHQAQFDHCKNNVPLNLGLTEPITLLDIARIGDELKHKFPGGNIAHRYHQDIIGYLSDTADFEAKRTKNDQEDEDDVSESDEDVSDSETEDNSGLDSDITDPVTQALYSNIIKPIITLIHTDQDPNETEWSLIQALSDALEYSDKIIQETQKIGFEEMKNTITREKDSILSDAENNPDNVQKIESALEILENSSVDFTNPLHFILVSEQEDINFKTIKDREDFTSFLSEIPNASIPQALALAALFGCNAIFRELVNTHQAQFDHCKNDVPLNLGLAEPITLLDIARIGDELKKNFPGGNFVPRNYQDIVSYLSDPAGFEAKRTKNDQEDEDDVSDSDEDESNAETENNSETGSAQTENGGNNDEETPNTPDPNSYDRGDGRGGGTIMSNFIETEANTSTIFIPNYDYNDPVTTRIKHNDEDYRNDEWSSQELEARLANNNTVRMNIKSMTLLKHKAKQPMGPLSMNVMRQIHYLTTHCHHFHLQY